MTVREKKFQNLMLRFETEAEGGADAILRSVMPDPVSHIINVGTNLDSSRAAVAQAARWEGMYAAVGIHPAGEFGIVVAGGNSTSAIADQTAAGHNGVALLDAEEPVADFDGGKRAAPEQARDERAGDDTGRGGEEIVLLLGQGCGPLGTA